MSQINKFYIIQNDQLFLNMSLSMFYMTCYNNASYFPSDSGPSHFIIVIIILLLPVLLFLLLQFA